MKHWSLFLPKQTPLMQAHREAIMANHSAIKRMVGQIQHLQKDITRKEMELEGILQPHFSTEELEQAYAQDTTIDIECIENSLIIPAEEEEQPKQTI